MMLTLSTLSDGDGDEIHYRVILYCTPPRIGSEAATATIEKAGGRSREREREVMPSCCCRWTRDHAASGGSNYRRLLTRQRLAGHITLPVAGRAAVNSDRRNVCRAFHFCLASAQTVDWRQDLEVTLRRPFLPFPIFVADSMRLSSFKFSW